MRFDWGLVMPKKDASRLVDYKLPDGRVVPIRFDAGEFPPLLVSYTLEGIKGVVYAMRVR